ncbi:DNA gyrase inhibitor YacG [Roseomonas sp. BN140053]|uniref:DNA gyrase inhibitor YacG n=1 Tax=Roseomonas sp. BN140053 TaxID=3391898 RepID=UPI0039E9AEA9
MPPDPPKPRRPAAPAACPICGRPVVPQHRPFCSPRCRQVDLGRWLSGDYAIPGEPVGAPDEED